MFVNFNILNQLGSPAINSNTFANRPAAGQTGRLFVSTDTFEIYRDNGTTWDLIGGPGSSTITGTGTATQVAYFTSSQAIGSSANLFWDNTSGFLGVATATPSARIEAVKTDGVGIYANFTTNAGSGSSTTGIYSKNTTNSSGYAAVIEESTPNTTAGQYPLLIKHSLSSGTAGVGMGTGLQFQLPDDAGTFKTTQLTIETINAAAATYATRYRFNVQNNGSSTPVAYINATGLGIFTATPGAALDIHSTGVIAQFNTTSATGNTYVSFQRTGTGVWRIGDTYNSGANFFGLFNNSISTNAIAVLAATNKTEFTAVENYTTGLARGNYFDYNLNVAAGGSFSSPNAITALGASLDLTLAGNATIPSGARSGLDAYNSISFTGTGTLTHNQGTQIRAYSNLTAGWAFNGTAIGTITHLAGLRALFPDNSGSAVNVTNNYALLLNDQTANTGTVTYTNRWGVYQEGASDLNYFAANTLIGTTVNAGYKLDVSGSANATTLYENGVRVTTTANISGTTNYLAKFTSANVVGNSIIFESSGNINLSGNTAIQLNSIPATTSQQLQFQNTGTNKWQLYLDTASNSFNIFNSTNSTNAITVDTSGNLGLALTPSAWENSTFKAFQVGTGNGVGSLIGRADGVNNTGLTLNAFYGSGGWTYIGSSYATYYAQTSGQHIWFNAPFGTAGNAITFTQAMQLNAAGNLSIGSSVFPIGFSRLSLVGGEASGTGANSGVQLTYNSSTFGGGAITTVNAAGGGLDFYTFTGNVGSESYTNRARITSGGNFLIGTTTDSGERLIVNGTNARFYNSGNYNSINIDNGTATGGGACAVFQNNIRVGAIAVEGWWQGTGQNDLAIVSDQANIKFYTNGSGTLKMSLSSGGNLEIPQGSIKTAAPTTGTAAAWKLGSRVAATVVLDTTQYIELDVGGTLYKLAIVT